MNENTGHEPHCPQPRAQARGENAVCLCQSPYPRPVAVDPLNTASALETENCRLLDSMKAAYELLHEAKQALNDGAGATAYLLINRAIATLEGK